jgi:hypothetical protein
MTKEAKLTLVRQIFNATKSKLLSEGLLGSADITLPTQAEVDNIFGSSTTVIPVTSSLVLEATDNGHYQDRTAMKMFDEDIGVAWYSNEVAEPTAIITLVNPLNISNLKILHNSRNLKYLVTASVDGVDYVTILNKYDEFIPMSDSFYSYNIGDSTKYKYLKIKMKTDSTYNDPAIQELQIIGEQ